MCRAEDKATLCHSGFKLYSRHVYLQTRLPLTTTTLGLTETTVGEKKIINLNNWLVILIADATQHPPQVKEMVKSATAAVHWIRSLWMAPTGSGKGGGRRKKKKTGEGEKDRRGKNRRRNMSVFLLQRLKLLHWCFSWFCQTSVRVFTKMYG